MHPATAPLIAQSLWWLVPYAVLILLMVHAMMEFTVTLLQRPPANRKPVAGDELRRRLQALTPAPLRRWTARRFWGVLYPLSYVLSIGYLVAIVGSLDRHTLLVLIGVSAGWWGVWGFLAWALSGFPAFWRRTRRKR